MATQSKHPNPTLEERVRRLEDIEAIRKMKADK